MPVTSVSGGSESTVRTVLFSGFRDAGDEYEPKWVLKTPIKHPPGNVGYITLDELHYRTPSVLGDHNQNGVITQDYGGGNPQNVQAGVFDIMDQYKYSDLTNSATLYFFLTQLAAAIGCGIGVYSSILNNYVRTTIANNTPNAPGNVVNTQCAWPLEIDITSNATAIANNAYPTTNPNYLGTDTFFNHAVSGNEIRLRLYRTNTNIRMTGNLLKMFKVSPYSSITLIGANATVDCVLANHGVNILKVHSNIGRSIMTSTASQPGLSQSNTLWVVNATSESNTLAWYTSQGIMNACPYITSTIDEINVYFTDEWNTKLTEMNNFTLMLSFDYKEKESTKSVNSLKRSRVSRPVTAMAETLRNIPYNRINA